MAIVAPLLEAGFRAPVVPQLFCSDASPTGGGATVAGLCPEEAAALWRLRSVRGGRARLAGPQEAYFIERG
eukprot:2010458-Lingulodinium_polyedra.AAC.1